MKISTALIAYLLTFVICILLPLGIGLLAKRKEKKICLLHFLIGLILFVIFAVGYFLIFKYHLTVKDGVGDYYNSSFYRVVIISLATILVSVFLWLIAMKAYVKRQALTECISFFVGFGCSGVALLGVYSLVMLLQLTIMSCTSTLLAFDTVKLAFHFSPDTYIFVFSPILGHVSYAIAFISFLFIAFCFAKFLNRLAMAQVPFGVSLFCFIVLVLSLVILVDVAAFLSMFNMPHYVMAIIILFFDIVAALAVRWTYQAERKAETGYKKQFD